MSGLGQLAALEGAYQIQGAPKIGGAGAAGGTAQAGTPYALTWINLSSMMSTVMGAAPLHDPGGQYISASSDSTGSSVTFNNKNGGGGLAGIWNSIRFNFGLGPSFLTGWDPTRYSVRFRGTLVTKPPLAIGGYMGIGFFHDLVQNCLGVRSAEYYRDPGGVEYMGLPITGIPAPELRLSCEIGIGAGTPAGPDLTVCCATSSYVTNSLSTWSTNTPYFQLYCNAFVASFSGPHTIKILWEYAIADIQGP